MMFRKSLRLAGAPVVLVGEPLSQELKALALLFTAHLAWVLACPAHGVGLVPRGGGLELTWRLAEHDCTGW
jgi:hypothetical protein